MPLPSLKIISSPRTTLREVCVEDLADLMEINGDPEVTRYLSYAPWQSEADAAAWLERVQAFVKNGTARQLVIISKHSQKVIGAALLFKYDEGNSCLELGYLLGRAHWRQGYGSEAVRSLLDHLFGDLGIRRVEATIDAANIASSALLISLGFTLEGVLRERWVEEDRPCDANIYGLLAREWLANIG